MKKIKFLHGFLIALNLLFVIVLLSNLLLIISSNPILAILKGEKFNAPTSIMLLFLSSLLVFGSFKIQQGLRSIIKNSFFNKKSETQFKQGGLFLILSSLGSFTFNLIIFNELSITNLATNFIQYFLILLIGFGLFIFADSIKKGTFLKQENELTI